MTLRALERIDNFPGFGQDAPPKGDTERAIIFVLDAGYLWPMKVLLHTLAQSGALVDLPIIVATEDESVFQDPIIDLVADVKFAIDRETIDVLELAATRARKRAGKETWTRATFLKWTAFRNWGFDEILFLDCDMIALGSPVPIFGIDGDIVGAPQFKRVLIRDASGALRPQVEIKERLARFVYKLGGSPLSLNSGVMVLRRKALTMEFLQQLSAFTATIACVNEQQYITMFARSEGATVNLNLISPIYNFQNSYLERISWFEQMRFLKKAYILHYAGRDKPWDRSATSESSIGHFLWWKAAADASLYLRPQRNSAERTTTNKNFGGSSVYWEKRYRAGGNSGKGSYGELAEFKASTLNQFVSKHGIVSVIEFGCGDGNQLALAKYKEYIGYDVSPQVVETCRRMFEHDRSKAFFHVDEYSGEKAELVLSLDVIFHLVEQDVFERYMRQIFMAATRYVVIYSSNQDRPIDPRAPHVRHRDFGSWVSANASEFRLVNIVKNPFGGSRKTREGHKSPSDFYFYELAGSPM